MKKYNLNIIQSLFYAALIEIPLFIFGLSDGKGIIFAFLHVPGLFVDAFLGNPIQWLSNHWQYVFYFSINVLVFFSIILPVNLLISNKKEN